MVAHLTYKFTHLAQSLRSGHLTNTLRNAFPSTATPAPTFDFTSNVFGSVSNAANSVGGSATTIGMAAGAFGAGAGAAAGAGGGAAGGAGGASSKAGSWSSWGFQSGKSLNQGQAAQADSPSQLDNADEDLARAFASPAVRRSLLRRTRSPVGLRSRSSFTPSSPPRPSHPDLLSADEAGLSSVRLSGVEMQRMYHTAFAQGKKTDEVKEMEMEADEVDLGVAPTEVLKTGRRASVSIGGLAASHATPLVSATGLGTSARRVSFGGQRPLHTSAPSASPAPPPSPASSARPSLSSTPAPSSTPPRASLPLIRRNSTSAVPSSSTPVDSSIPFIDRSKTPPPFFSSEGRPPIDGEKQKKGPKWAKGKTPEQIIATGKASGQLLSPEAQDRQNAILAAEKTGKPGLVARAVQQYLAARNTWSTQIHNTAMVALYKTRQPNDPLDRIVELYNQLFSESNLHPTTLSYDTIIRSFCSRDDEVRRNIDYIEKRMKKKVLAAKARGLYYQPSETTEYDNSTLGNLDDDFDSQFAMKSELKRLEQLRSPEFDYFTPALQIYKALGTLGDRLPSASVQYLLECAAERGETDVALALFERLEKSPYQRPFFRAYQSLIRMYGSIEKDSELVKEVFEGYLTARATGVLRDGLGFDKTRAARRPIFRFASIKHAYDTEPDFVVEQDDRRGMITTGEAPDERIWATTMGALFDAGDAAGAVALLERLLAAQSSPETLAPGYPKTLISRTIGLVVRGFVKVGDEASARKWFDQFGNPEHGVQGDDIPYTAFYAGILYAAVDAPLPSRTFLNHVYRSMLAIASKTNPLQVSDFVTVVDCNLATTWSETATSEQKAEALDAIAEFRTAFEQATKAGLLAEHIGVDFRLSSGLLTRIASAEGASSRFPRATSTFLELANLVRGAMRETPADAAEARNQSYRPRTTWAIRVTTAARGVLGVHPAKDGGHAQLRQAGEPIIAVEDAAKIVSWTNKLRRVVEWGPDTTVALALVQSYLASRANSAPVALSGDEWFTVLEAFAWAASAAKRNPEEMPIEVPEFRLVFQDFVASGVEIPVGQGFYDYETLAKKLKDAGYQVDEVRGFIETMLRNGEYEPAVAQEAQTNPAAFVEDDSASLASGSIAPATSATAPSVADSAEPQRYPTPPSTPPAYFAELAPAPPAVPEAAPAPTPASFDRQLGTQIEQLAFVGRTSDASRLALEGLNLAVAAAREGRYAHPDSYGRLIEQLGRQHLVQEVRQVYLLAYEALNAMAGEPEAQSIAWVMLEDKMIIALAQAGELIDVSYHRDRLFQAGCAPSADAYAAMILNMKDTTDDAAVALTLFEESQRLNVRPNVYLFNTLISKLSRARRAKEALEYFELMKHCGLTPTSITYGAIINACCKTGDDVSADYLFSEMVTRPDFKPRVPPYNTMIQFYTSTKPDRARALHYFNELVKARVDPTAHTYKLLLDAYGATGDVPDLEAMQQVFARLVADRKVKVSGAHWAALINAYGVVAKDVDRAIAIFDSIPAHPTTRGNPNGPLPDAVVYEALLNGLIANGRAELCDQYLEEMRTKGVRMTAYVANTLIKGYTAQSLYSSARRIFNAMSEPPSGVASAGNHPIDRHPKHHHLASTTPVSVDAPTYREPSTYEAMILCELKAGEVGRAAEVLRLAEARAFPPAVIGRLQKLLTDEGIESLPLQQQ